MGIRPNQLQKCSPIDEAPPFRWELIPALTLSNCTRFNFNENKENLVYGKIDISIDRLVCECSSQQETSFG